MFRRRKCYWHTPPLDILGEDSAGEASSIISPGYIAQLLAQIGLPCRPAGHTSGAQITTYHYNLITIKDYNKAPRAVSAICCATCAMQLDTIRPGAYGNTSSAGQA